MAARSPYLRTGEEYKESLRDGREVWYHGERVEDVTAHPAMKAGIDFQARIYDAQHDPATEDVLTYVGEDGHRRSTSWLVPRTREDLLRKLADSEFRSWESFGAFHSRQPNHVAWVIIGQLAYQSVFREHAPEWADNLARYVEHASRNNIATAASIIEPQGTMARSAKAGDDRSSVMRVVSRDSGGVVISGAKAVGTAAPMSHDVQIGSIYYPHVRPEEAFWCAIPLNTPGIRIYCREAVAPTGNFRDHPLASIGEELDCLVVYDEVYVPNDRIWALDAPKTCDPALFGTTGGGEFWIHLSRSVVKAELMVGLAQLVADVLETGSIPAVQEHVNEITQWALILRGGIGAALDRAALTPDGVLLPHIPTINAFRAYGLDHYPRMNQLLQQMCGQGLVTRLTEADLAVPQIRADYERYHQTGKLSAEDKNLVMNLVFDVTSSAYAGRSEIFDNVNGLPAGLLRSLLYYISDRSGHVERVRSLIGLGEQGTAGGARSATEAWHTGGRKG